MKTALAPYVRILGRGPSFSRSLTREEAEAAMGIVLAGDAAPEALGAMLMLMRMKGETADEIAGFATAARAAAPVSGALSGEVALDWPSYAAGRTRGLPWFLLAAKLVASAGHPVLLHGWNSHQGSNASVRAALGPLGIPVAQDRDVRELATGIAYLPLETLSMPLFDILGLRAVFNLRSCINTVLRVLNPAGAAASVQGVFHPPYRQLQQDACLAMGQKNLTVLKGGGGEFERNPSKDIALFGLRNGVAFDEVAAPMDAAHVRLADGAQSSDPAALPALWSGELEDAFALSIVLGTADLALQTLGVTTPASELWQARDRSAIAA
ncbi:glycosyl transferase family protein [Celeribacter arenosi]|uniref:Glycosyl transferase family protein n=1 Tax=Celeribacter arenosi TaxID=792649 RepID=A0ABP7KDR3_9RHOB